MRIQLGSFSVKICPGFCLFWGPLRITAGGWMYR